MHGIIFRMRRGKSIVSCECRAVYGKHSRIKGGDEYYEAMETNGEANLFKVYNNPDNHWEEFLPVDRIGPRR